MDTPTPYHLQSPRTIVTKIISMKRQEPEPPPPKIILQPRHRTSPVMWCAAIVCFVFSVLVILAGLVILIVFLAVKPRRPSFDVANATLNSVYVGSPSPYFNGDMTLMANISNPNHKIGVMIQSGGVELLFRGRLVSAQALPSFAQRRRQFTVLNVHMLSSQDAAFGERLGCCLTHSNHAYGGKEARHPAVRSGTVEEPVPPPEVAVELLNQMKSNKIYTVRGTFKVRERFWS